jgi:site-specific DNA recombinase
MGAAPLGYKNSRDENNKPIMVPDENAILIQLAFEEMASGNFTKKKFDSV